MSGFKLWTSGDGFATQLMDLKSILLISVNLAVVMVQLLPTQRSAVQIQSSTNLMYTFQGKSHAFQGVVNLHGATVNCIEKTKINKKEAGNCPFKKTYLQSLHVYRKYLLKPENAARLSWPFRSFVNSRRCPPTVFAETFFSVQFAASVSKK